MLFFCTTEEEMLEILIMISKVDSSFSCDETMLYFTRDFNSVWSSIAFTASLSADFVHLTDHTDWYID